MSRILSAFAVIAAAALVTVGARAQDGALPCHSRLNHGALANNVDAPKSDPTGVSLCLQGAPGAVRLEVHQVALDAVLSALFAAYKVSYRSAVQLNEARDGRYEGTLRHVIARVLDGYNYVIKQENSHLEITIFNTKGKQAVVGPVITEASQNRVPAPVSRIR
jgi:hypothetical protein